MKFLLLELFSVIFMLYGVPIRKYVNVKCKKECYNINTQLKIKLNVIHRFNLSSWVMASRFSTMNTTKKKRLKTKSFVWLWHFIKGHKVRKPEFR